MRHLECADMLNSFNEDVLNRKIDDLVNEAIYLDLSIYDENVFNSVLKLYCVFILYAEICLTNSCKNAVGKNLCAH